MELLDAALERCKTRIKDNIDPSLAPLQNGEMAAYSELRKDGSVNLRLDWELASDVVQEVSVDKLLDLMFVQAESDLEKLLEDGDIDHTTDPLLKALDGAKKRGRQPSAVDITAVNLIQEFSSRKETVRYTMYLTLNTQW